MSLEARAIGFLMLFLIVGAGTAAAQTGKAPGGATTAASSPVKVVLTPLFAPPGDSSASQIASAATSALSLMLHLSGSFTVVDAPKLDPIMAYRESVAYYRRLDAAVGMFGTVTPGLSGSYTITVQYWQSTKPTAPPSTFTRDVSSVQGAVQAADELAVSVASAAAGRTLKAGTVEVNNLASLPSYSLYADGRLAARNKPRIRLLAGTRTITVEVPGPGGDHLLESFQVEVIPGKTVSVALHTTGAAGSLKVLTRPAGATVLLDGKRVGITPLGLAAITPGSHRLRILHRYFAPVEKMLTVTTGKVTKVEVSLEVNRNDPAVVARLTSPLGVAASSLLWSAVQFSHFYGIIAGARSPSGLTSSFLTTGPGFAGGSFPIPVLLDISLNLSVGRIGARLVGDSTLRTVDDLFSMTAAAAFASSVLLPGLFSSSQSQQTSYTNAGNALAGVAGMMLFDIASSPIAAAVRDRRLRAYLSTHGTLPPLRAALPLRPHLIVVETGGDSLVRLGFREPLIRNYLSLEESMGLGAVTLQPFSPALAVDAIVAYNPWGPSTGRLRPEVFGGMRALTNFSSGISSIEPEIGTGNDWIGRFFDIFVRGGLGYDLTNRQWDQFFSMGTRLF